MPCSDLIFAGDYLPTHALDRSVFARESCVVANLEAAFAAGAPPASKAYPICVGEEAWANVRAAGLAAVSVANNHTCDAGEAGFEDMVRRLAAMEGLQVYGLREKPYAELTVAGRKCAVIGCLEPCRSRGRRIFREEDVAKLIREIAGRYERVFVTPHWGKEGEYASHPSPGQRRRAAEWIGAGAAAVFGHHTHTFHGMETISQKPVFYSLGNLLFDHEEGNRYPLASFGLAVRWTPGSGGDGWESIFLQGRGGRLAACDQRTRDLLAKYFDAISADLEGWTAVRWARAVGPVCIEKARRSWARRFTAGFARTLPLWALWNMLPATLLLRWGAAHPDRNLLDRRRAMEAALDGGRRSVGAASRNEFGCDGAQPSTSRQK